MQVNEIWIKLFRFWDTLGENYRPSCLGITKEEIRIYQKMKNINFVLPYNISESLKICNRIIYSEEYIKSGNEWKKYSTNKLYSLFHKTPQNIPSYALEILSLEEIINVKNINKELLKEWILFYTYDFWFSAVLDTITGKIYCYENETGRYVFWKNSYEEWLEMAVDEVVQYGELRLETMEKLLGIEE